MTGASQLTRTTSHEPRLTDAASRVAGVGRALPPHRYEQAVLTEAFGSVVGLTTPSEQRLLTRLHANAGVRTRHLALPLEAYAGLGGFTAANDAFLDVAVDLGARALDAGLEAAGLDAADVDVVITATVTGLAIPSLDARLIARCGLRHDVKRVPLVGLGCVAGAAGVARAHDYLLGHPSECVALVCVELCSLTVQADDRSVANLVASGLFGDGAGCVVLVGPEHPSVTGRGGAGRGAAGPSAGAGSGSSSGSPGRTGSGGGTGSGAVRVLATRSRFYADTERAMGFDVGGHGLRIVLDAQVPTLVETHLRADVDGFLADHGLARADLDFYVAHPGGPKVLEALESALETPPGALDVTWASLAEVGNLSSASVLHVLHDTLAEHHPAPGTRGLLLAMGPGFCSELVLLEVS